MNMKVLIELNVDRLDDETVEFLNNLVDNNFEIESWEEVIDE